MLGLISLVVIASATSVGLYTALSNRPPSASADQLPAGSVAGGPSLSSGEQTGSNPAETRDASAPPIEPGNTATSSVPLQLSETRTPIPRPSPSAASGAKPATSQGPLTTPTTSPPKQMTAQPAPSQSPVATVTTPPLPARPTEGDPQDLQNYPERFVVHVGNEQDLRFTIGPQGPLPLGFERGTENWTIHPDDGCGWLPSPGRGLSASGAPISIEWVSPSYGQTCVLTITRPGNSTFKVFVERVG